MRRALALLGVVVIVSACGAFRSDAETDDPPPASDAGATDGSPGVDGAYLDGGVEGDSGLDASQLVDGGLRPANDECARATNCDYRRGEGCCEAAGGKGAVCVDVATATACPFLFRCRGAGDCETGDQQCIASLSGTSCGQGGDAVQSCAVAAECQTATCTIATCFGHDYDLCDTTECGKLK